MAGFELVENAAALDRRQLLLVTDQDHARTYGRRAYQDAFVAAGIQHGGFIDNEAGIAVPRFGAEACGLLTDEFEVHGRSFGEAVDGHGAGDRVRGREADDPEAAGFERLAHRADGVGLAGAGDAAQQPEVGAIDQVEQPRGLLGESFIAAILACAAAAMRFLRFRSGLAASSASAASRMRRSCSRT
jgi:hypothetical protein